MDLYRNESRPTCSSLAGLNIAHCTDLVSAWAWCFPADGVEAEFLAPSANLTKPGYCLCSFYQGFEGPACEKRTAATDFNFAMNFTILLGEIAGLVYSIRVRSSKRKKRTKRTAVELSLDMLVVSWLLFCAWMVTTLLDNLQLSPVLMRVREAMVVTTTTFTMVCWLLIALGWIEICQAVKQMTRLTRNRSQFIVYFGSAVYVLTAVPLYITKGYAAVSGLLILTIIIMNTSFFIGARKISSMLLGAKTSAMTLSGGKPDSKAQKLSDQLNKIVRTSLYVHLGSFIFLVSGFLAVFVFKRRLAHRTYTIRPFTIFTNFTVVGIMVSNFGMTWFFEPKSPRRKMRRRDVAAASESGVSAASTIGSNAPSSCDAGSFRSEQSNESSAGTVPSSEEDSVNFESTLGSTKPSFSPTIRPSSDISSRAHEHPESHEHEDAEHHELEVHVPSEFELVAATRGR